jgi:glyoxylase-like metal-dependent hydrolase (beta-lactamase superfamily II)
MEKTVLQRRTMLQGILGGMAVIAFVPALQAASAAPATVLAGNISLLNIGGVNVVAAITDNGVVLVDTGAKESALDLIEQLQAMSRGADYTLFNTHWHSDQTGGNEAFGNAHAKIIAHKKTFLHLSTDNYIPPENRYFHAVPKAAFPTDTFYTNATLEAGNETIDYGYLMQAHTDGDIYVYFRNANVLAVGDVVSPERDPVLDWYGGGWLGGRVDAMDLLLELGNDATQFVPSYGPVVSKAQVRIERDMMAFLYEKLVDQVRMGFSAKDSLDSGVMNGLMRTFTDPEKFLYDAHKGLWAHHNKLAPNIV